MDGKRAGEGQQDRWLCRSGYLLGAPRDRACFHHHVRDVRGDLLRGLRGAPALGTRVLRASLGALQALPNARARAAVRLGLSPADRADVEACRIVKKEPARDARAGLPCETSRTPRHCLLDGLWLAPPFYS